MSVTTTTWARHRSRRLAPRAATGAAATALALLAAACTAAVPDPAATTAAVAAVGTIPWAPCDPGLEGAEVPVPMDWMNPSGETTSWP